MKRFSLAFLGMALILSTGCNSAGSGTTAPSTNPSKPSDVRSLKVHSPTHQSIKQNGTADVDISVDRKNFKGPVELKFELPPGVTLASQDTTIPADKDSLKVSLKAAADAKVENDLKARVTATAKDQKDLASDTVEFPLEVKLKD